MKKFCVALSSLFFILSFSLQAAISPDMAKRRMHADLEFIKNVFEVKYAPLEWKRQYSGWDLEHEFSLAKAKIDYFHAPTTKDFHTILKEFFNSTKDYHVGIQFYSTEEAALPFVVKGAEGRYFISHIFRSALPHYICPMEAGDEILSFGGSPVSVAIDELRRADFGDNTPETDQALAELSLTMRQGERGQKVPQGDVEIVVKRKRTGKVENYKLKWEYTPEKIHDFTKLGSPLAAFKGGKGKPLAKERSEEFFKKMMVYHSWTKEREMRVDNTQSVGARRSFIPPLGRKLWTTSSNNTFDAYIFGHPNGKRVGYVRIPHYMGDEDEVYEFGKIISHMESNSDALIIDQINNPGGSVFYLYGLASTLTDYKLYAPKHHLMLTQQEVDLAVNLLPLMENAVDDTTACQLFGMTIGGYPMSFEVVRLMREFCTFIIDEWNAGHIYTAPTQIFGIEDIHPHPKTHYTKPILLLINSLDFSGGDFFPAILQDNKRALVMGTRTAGAGGYVIPTQFPNRTAISGFHLTGSLAERINSEPIENLGVKPDIEYQLTTRDLQENYAEYVEAILGGVDTLLQNPK